MNIESIMTRWTHCYHVTAVVNLPSLRRSGTLLPAATLFRLTGRDDLLNRRRTHDVHLPLRGQNVLVRNQIPLDPDSINLGSAESLEDYIACLNAHVFFWPGTSSGPAHDGIRMFQMTPGVNAIIRVQSRSLFETNKGSPLHFSTCNTGASWVVNGKKSLRGSDVFQHAKYFDEPPSRIQEISFRGCVNLPDNSECGNGFGQRWHSLYIAEAADR
jgi:hypothetical protein